MQKQKARFLLLQRFRKGDEICFKRDETNFREIERKPDVRRKALRRVFSLCATVGLLLLKSRANSLFPEEPKVFGKSGALCQKCDFGTRSKLLRHVAECRAFTFPAAARGAVRCKSKKRGQSSAAWTKFVFKRDETNFVRSKENPTFAERLCAGFLSLRDGRASPIKKSRKFTLSGRSRKYSANRVPLCQKCDFGTRSKLLRHVAECRCIHLSRGSAERCEVQKQKAAVFTFAEISEGGRNLFQKR